MPFLGISWAIEGIPPHVRGLFPLSYATCSVGITLWITMFVKSRRSRRPKSRARRLGSASSAGELVEDRFGLALAPPADAWLASTGAVSREGREVHAMIAKWPGLRPTSPATHARSAWLHLKDCSSKLERWEAHDPFAFFANGCCAAGCAFRQAPGMPRLHSSRSSRETYHRGISPALPGSHKPPRQDHERIRRRR